MPNEIIFRHFKIQDRAEIRRICCDTADQGRPIENFYPYRDIAADLLTRYYTDYEPGSTWVAELNGQVIGYLNGCLDSRRCTRIMTWRLVPRIFLKSMKGPLWRKESWRWFCIAFKSWRAGGFDRHIDLTRYMAHLHINVNTNFRGRAVGQRLMECFIKQARDAGVKGIHAIVTAENISAGRFFEKAGFLELSRHRMLVPDGKQDKLSYSIVYGRSL